MPRILRLLLAASLALAVVVGATSPTSAATKRALFDNAHAEQAGNADWVIDDQQPTPSPSQAAIVPSTPRTYWTGAISSWGVDLVKRGFTVSTNTTAFTYGNPSNPLDLTNFDVLIVPEPNTLFSAAEATAILNFVHDGGGLIAVSDHDGSDRNNDGADSPKIWNALDPSHLLGVHFGSTGDPNNNIVQTSSNVATAASDSITRGPEGNVPGLAFHNGTTLTLFPGTNPTVRGEVWMTGLSQTSLTGVMAASSQYGSGRVFFCGDSSPIDDGSANPGNINIFDGWGESADSLLFMNATQWASRRDVAIGDGTPPVVTLTSPNGGENWKAGSTHAILWTATDNVGVTGVDLAWSSDGGATFPNTITLGLANSGNYSWLLPIALSQTVRVRATARDAAANAGSDASDANFTISLWQVTTSAGAGGSVSPSGATGVPEGGSLAVNLAPTTGFAIADVLVDAVSVGPLATFTFSNVSANHTLAASFADIAPPNVTITSPIGGEAWNVSTQHAITWTAGDNVAVDSVNVDWSPNGGVGSWTPVAHALANSGNFNWTLPAAPTDSALVRVTAFDHAGNNASATSASLFRIVDPNLGVPEHGPSVLALARPTPNPSHGAARLRFSLPAAGDARLEVLDVGGRRVWAQSHAFAAGPHELRWDGRDDAGHALGAGLYLVRLVTPWGTRGTRLAWVP